MITFDATNFRRLNIPELPVGTRFKLNGWVDPKDFPDGEPDVVFEVMEAKPDTTGDIPCCSDEHRCAFADICNLIQSCPCTEIEREDGYNVRYIEFVNGEEIYQ